MRAMWPRQLAFAAAAVVFAGCAGGGEDSPAATPETTANGVTTVSGATTAPTRPPLGETPDPGPAPTGHGISADDLSAAVGSSVRISGMACGVLSEGSGFAVQSGDLIATNAHVLVGVDEPEVDTAGGRRLTGRVVAFDAANDLALLHVDGAQLVPLPLRLEAPDGTVGAVLAWRRDPAAGSLPAPTPFRIDRPVTVRIDEVAGTNRVERQAWLLAADIARGYSGAALITVTDGRAEAVGVVWGSSRRSSTDTVYATRASELASLLDEADTGTAVTPPRCR